MPEEPKRTARVRAAVTYCSSVWNGLSARTRMMFGASTSIVMWVKSAIGSKGMLWRVAAA